mmetsp:Transcript_35957/g.76777  ORF Transcript_35957/g.76777 Transcript_35957/m.76777 type:complete len:311 (+) Transcript_35957:1167-2099(+)
MLNSVRVQSAAAKLARVRLAPKKLDSENLVPAKLDRSSLDISKEAKVSLRPERSMPLICEFEKSLSLESGSMPLKLVDGFITQPSHSSKLILAVSKFVPLNVLVPMKTAPITVAPLRVARSNLASNDSPSSARLALSRLVSVKLTLVMLMTSVMVIPEAFAFEKSAPMSDVGPVMEAPARMAREKLALSRVLSEKVAPARFAPTKLAPVQSITLKVAPLRSIPRRSTFIRSGHSGVASTRPLGTSTGPQGCGGGGGATTTRTGGGGRSQVGLPGSGVADMPEPRTLFVKQKEPSTGTTWVTCSLCSSQRE